MDATNDDKSKQQIVYTWAPETEQLLQDWRNRVYAAQSAYYMLAERCTRWNYLLGIPVVIVSGLVGTAIFTDLQSNIPHGKLLVGSVSIMAAVLSSLQTFLRFEESATHHGTAATWYAAIRRDIEELLALPRELRGDPKVCLDLIRRDMNKASQKAPPLSERSWAKVASRFGVNEPPVTGMGG